ncbi:single-stranded DNA-binding protein [Xylanimonas protaetiae]|uniref:Single-stranded DNA-binding protein n=1 Tax=Xylanimonas protaetiae TaxID=2509457 RepID=A0A4P6F3N2_9MICO|nr:single-stranded DNA-binding protein [Xylanimonas protaetiae]QAY68799.1 hypothetical protein ET471_01000 [Xylanimonas protaetiae]
MSIPTRQCIVGEVASRPEWSRTVTGSKRLYARITVTARRRLPDGTYSDPQTTTHALVMFGGVAERSRTRLRQGDFIVAAGYVRANTTGNGEEFVARWWGHEARHTEYTVTRTPTRVRLPFRPRTPTPPPVPRFVAPDPAPAA